jgi:transglutaminase-like putative cysteine protease
MSRLRSLALPAFSASIILVAFLLSPQCASAIGFQPVSPDELKLTSEPKAPGATAIILFRQVDRDDNGRTTHEDDYFRIKILKEEGRKHADIEIPFIKEYEDVTNLHARTIRPDGTIAEFTGKAFDKTIVKSKDWKYLAKTFTLTDVQPGSIIEYYYTIDFNDQSRVFFSHWIVSNELFTKHAKFSLKPYTMFHQGLRFRWNWQGIAEGPKQGADHIVRMEVNDIPAFETEKFMPPPNALKAHVDFIYSSDPVLESDTDRYWKRAGKQMHDKVESFAGKKKSAMEQAVSQIVSPSDSPEEEAQEIYARVQQLRNTTYEVRKTEEEKKREKEKDDSNVEDVWKRGYGNGVQLTWLYLALTRAAGLEAYGVMVSDRANYFFDPNLHDDRNLDSNVVLLHFKDKDVYCDPGAAYTPYGLLPWAEAGARGLKLDRDGGQWIDTKLPDSKVSQIARKATLNLIPETGAVEGKLIITYTGLEASTRRVEERNVDETAHKKFLENEVRELVPSAVEAELVNKPDWHSSSTPLIAEFDLKIPGWAEAAGRRVMLPVGLFSSPEKHVFDHAKRVHPIYFRYPSGRVDDVTIELPEGWRISSVPPANNEDQKIIAYSSKVENDKGVLHISRKFTTDVIFLDTKYYPALQDFYRMIRTSDEQQVVLLPGTANASN